MDKSHSELSQISARLNIFLAISLFIAGYVGGRMPSMWSINYYIPSFFEGFYRRGLVGSILYPFGALRFNYDFISSIQIAVFVLLLLCILRYAYQADVPRKIMLVLFFLAPTGGYLFHLIGYVDHLLYLLLFIALISNQRMGLMLMVASLFIHEEALFTTIPIYLSSLLINRISMRWLLINIGVIGFSFLVLTLFFQTVDVIKIEHFIQKIITAFGPFARTEYYFTFNNHYTTQALTNTFIELNGQTAATPPQGHYDFLYFEIAIIGALACLIAKQFMIKECARLHNVFCFLAVFCSCTAPLLLVFFGIDSYRWVFMSFSSCVFLFCLIKDKPSMSYFLPIAFVFVLFLAYGNFWYFDGYVPRLFEKANLITFWQTIF